MKRVLGLTIGLLLSCGGSSETITGVWDLMGGAGLPTKGVLSIDATSLTVSMDRYTFTMHVEDTKATINWQSNSGLTTITGSRIPANLNTGAFPLALGGDWMLSSAGSSGSCVSSLRNGLVDGNCSGVGSTPVLSLNNHATLTRTAALDSRFGDLGGEWTLLAASKRCGVTISGSTIRATCGANDGFTLNFADNLVSGRLDSGTELAARRH